MNMLARLAARLGFKPPAPASAPHARRFEAAILNRLTAGWMGSVQSIDEELRGDLDRLRARSRDLAANNDYVRKFIKMVQANVVGPNGFTLQVRVENSPGQPDELANLAIETAWAKWCRRDACDIAGQQGFAELCRSLIADAARDGEFLVYRVRGAAAGNAFGYALQRLDVSRIATAKHEAATGNGNAVVMGIEITAVGKPVALHLYKANPGGATGTRDIERVAIGDIFHCYLGERPEQRRGFPWLHTAMQRLHQLKGYEEAAVIAARVGAAKMGFFTSPDGAAGPIGEQDADSGEFITSADAGEFQVLPQGYDFKSFDPDYPHQQFGEFVKATLRGISSGLNISYNTLANDLEGVNFSSIRSGVLEEREQWMSLQGWFIESFLLPVYEEWLQLALLKGAITMPNGSALPAAKREKFAAHTWQPRRWAWVDPLKDIEASVVAIENGLASPYTIAAQMGVDIDDVLADIARFQASAKAKGVTLGKPAAPAPAAPAETPDPAVKALAAITDLQAEVRSMAARAPAPAITVAVNADEMARAAHAVRDGLLEQTRELTQQIREDIQNMPIVIPAPVVNVAAPSVTVENRVEPAAVTLEANLPPAEITVAMPPRRTETSIRYNASGEIISTTQIETDA